MSGQLHAPAALSLERTRISVG